MSQRSALWVSPSALETWRHQMLTANPDMYQIHAMVDELTWHREQASQLAGMAELVPELQLLAIEGEKEEGPYCLIVKQLKLFAAEIRRLQKEVLKRDEACRAALVFHGSDWSEEPRQRWRNLTQYAEATTKGLCDFIRRQIGLGENDIP